ncbi:UNVERIFIED_CONTAM: Transcription factor DIVARICATA [Sesamum latifolium]|uniref:Transcription factor DIVARICATA n=1 Tax=Sesamum latifolium TaxID=2727402 RepID=A0AAW2TC25_9LAMI
METLCPSSGWMIHQGHSTPWTKEENKRFESALAIFDEKTPNRWFKVAAMIPGKSVYDVINQYRELVADVSDIEAGLVPIPGYLASSFTLELSDHRGFDVYRKRPVRSCDHERKKGVPWTEDEHRRFLLGLQKHGKGDWRNISRNFVISKTPTQVASHAQKYYLRQISGGKDKRRPSIHDITTVSLTGTAPTDSSKSPDPLEKSNVGLITSVQSPTNAPKIVLDWDHNNNDEALMVFNASCVDPFVARPHDIAPRSRYVVNNVGSGPGFCMQLPRFHA